MVDLTERRPIVGRHVIDYRSGIICSERYKNRFYAIFSTIAFWFDKCGEIVRRNRIVRNIALCDSAFALGGGEHCACNKSFWRHHVPPNEFAEDGRKHFVENPRLERFAVREIAFSEDAIKPLLGNQG